MTKPIKIHLKGPLLITKTGKKLQWTMCGKPLRGVTTTTLLEMVDCKVCRSSKAVPSWAWTGIV